MENNPNYYMTSLGTTRNQTKARGQEAERENVPKDYQAKKEIKLMFIFKTNRDLSEFTLQDLNISI